MGSTITNIILTLLEKAITEGKEILSMSLIVCLIWSTLVIVMMKQYGKIIKQAFEIIEEQQKTFQEIEKIITRMTIRSEYEEEIANLLTENKKLQETNGHLNFMIEKNIINKED